MIKNKAVINEDMGPGFWKKKYDELLKKLDGGESMNQTINTSAENNKTIQPVGIF
jgi:hypothetical protein